MRAAMWQPRPYVAYTVGGPISWWFYRLSPGCDALYEPTALGRAWKALWLGLVRRTVPRTPRPTEYDHRDPG